MFDYVAAGYLFHNGEWYFRDGTPLLGRINPFTLTAGQSEIFYLQEGDMVTCTGGEGVTGTIVRTDSAGVAYPTIALVVGKLASLGAYSGLQQFSISCSAGSVDVSVGAAVLGALKVTDQKSTFNMPQRIYVSAPVPPSPTDGAAHTYDGQLPAKREFSGIRLIYENLNTAAVMNISAARVGSAPRHLLSTGAEIAWWPNLLTVNGATSWAVPAAKLGTTAGGNQRIRGFSITDFVPLQPVARTDSATFGSNPLTRARARIPAEVQYPYSVGSGFAPAWNAYSGNGGMLVGSVLTSGDFATAPPTDTAYTIVENGGFINPVMAIFSYVDPGRSIFAFSDSLFQGVGSSIGNGAANGFLGWPLLVHCQAPLIDVMNLAVAGQNTEDSLANMKAFISVLDEIPTYVAIKASSPNDGVPTQAIVTANRWRIMDAISYLRGKGITPMIFTSPPVNSWTSGQHAFNEAINAWVLSLPSVMPWVIVVDMCAVVRDPANNRQILPAYNYDGTHYLTAGHQAISDAVRAALAG